MAGTLQPLDQKFAIADADGLPTDYFTRWAQQRMDDIVAAATADQVTLAIDTWAAARLINTASPLEGGGSLAADLNLSHAASGVVAGTYGDATNVAQITVDADGHITDVVNVVITGGGGGSTAWSSITGTPTTLGGYGITNAAPLSHVGSGGVSQHALVVAAGAAGFMSGADKTKLDGIAAGATANATDAFLLARANHTGTQGVGTITGLGYFATGTDAANLTGTVPAGQLPQFTGGDVTTAGVGSVNLTIGPATVTLAKMANLAANSIIGNNTGAGATPIALTVAQVKALLAIAAGDVSGLGYFATGTSAANLTGTLPTAQLPTLGGGLFVSGSTLYGAVVHPGYVAGNWYAAIDGIAFSAGAAPAANSIRLLPFTLSKPITISDLGARVTTLSSSNSFQLAIYANNAATGRPTGNALCSTGNISTGATAAVSAALGGGNVTLSPGTYWMALNQNNAVAAYQTIAQATCHFGFLIGSTTLANVTGGAASANMCLSVAQAFGTWPDLTSASFGETINLANALVFLKAA